MFSASLSTLSISDSSSVDLESTDTSLALISFFPLALAAFLMRVVAGDGLAGEVLGVVKGDPPGVSMSDTLSLTDTPRLRGLLALTALADVLGTLSEGRGGWGLGGGMERAPEACEIAWFKTGPRRLDGADFGEAGVEGGAEVPGAGGAGDASGTDSLVMGVSVLIRVLHGGGSFALGILLRAANSST